MRNSAVIPALLLAGLNAYNLWNEHWEHVSHMPPLEERVEYPYQNIRTKNFPWGDGDKTILYVLYIVFSTLLSHSIVSKEKK
jgi:cytochrome c oxidase subunit 6a